MEVAGGAWARAWLLGGRLPGLAESSAQHLGNPSQPLLEAALDLCSWQQLWPSVSSICLSFYQNELDLTVFSF